MKRVTFLQSIAAIMGLLLVTGIGCSKFESQNETATNPQIPIMTDDDINVMNKIVAFREKLAFHRENPDFKSEEVMSAEDVVWNLETLFNATYGFPDEQYGRTKGDNAVLYIDINSNGDVMLDDMVALYDDIITLVTQHYYNSGFDQKGFLLIDLTQGEISDGQLEIGLMSVTGEKNTGWEPFGADDFWYYGNEAGDCDLNNAGTDAAEKIQEAIMYNKPMVPLVAPPPGYRFVYSNYEDVFRFGHEYADNSGEYLIFYIENPMGTFTWEEKCLNPDEMNFHFFGESEVIYNILPVEMNKPTNWTFMSCVITGKEETNPGNGNIPSIHHNNKLTYAIRHLVPIGIIEPPIDL